MSILDIVLSIILFIAAVFLIVAVLMQSGKSHGLSGSIAGGAETFFGKTKGKTFDKTLSRLTTIVSIVFVVLVLTVYIAHKHNENDTFKTNTKAAETTAAVTEMDTSADTQ